MVHNGTGSREELPMIVRKLALATATAALVAAPVAAQDAEAGRSSAPAVQESELRGNSTLFFVLAIVAVAAGIVLLIDDDDPASP